MKKVTKTWDCEVAVRIKAKNVLKPPLNTAGPISFKAWVALSFLVPEIHT